MQALNTHSLLTLVTSVILPPVSGVYGIAIRDSTSSGYPNPSVVERDVIVVGGGSGGTFASVRLAQLGKSVALIEREDRLGGNVATYADPATNKTLDYGVNLYSNISVARDYLASLDIDTIAYEGYYPGGKTLYLDYTSREVLPAAAPGNETAAAQIYYREMEKYGDLFSAPGYFLPDPIPSDLLLPWGEWLKKYNATAFAYDVFYVQAGNALQQLTLYIMKYYNLSGFRTNAITTKNHGNQIIYNTAYARLGGAANVFLSSKIRSIVRSNEGVVARVETPNGIQIIKSKKLVIAIRPKYIDLKPFLDLRQDETRLTKQFTNIHTWTAVLKDTGLPDDVGVELVDSAAEGGVPALPETLGIAQSGIPGIDARAYWWCTQTPITRETAESQMLRTADFVQQSLNYTSPNGTKPSLSGLERHSPYFVYTSREAVAGGFYKELNELQGRYNTFWTGAAWESENSASIWKFTEEVMLPALLKSLG
ncbi:FAD/NAD(P)-binding domain-containing protein [Polychaeton citri CBS 116435]|uniref:FAD/NAD(P)-binding domain-containing protein n=1 Tax=Polychaeton citri CBS 116435 TaxID=1314669 RepID=A0A9P4UTK5_9PEZI|nr:FAD/NAD(P)-binding domain-containing protein [Polychaeton citri CBS 116435]